MTASMDMFPQQLRKGGRRELLILGVAIVCYLMGLLLVTEVRRQGGTPDSSEPFLPSARGGGGRGLTPSLLPHAEVEGPTH